MRKIQILIGFLLFGCGDVDPKSVGVGVLSNEVVNKVEAVLEPDYQLFVAPTSLCGRLNEESEQIKCVVSPCKERCSILYANFDVFIEQHNYFSLQTLSSRALTNVLKFCSKNKEVCVREAASIDGSSILITKE